MVPVPVAAEKACLFDPRNPQQPVACDYRGDRSLRPIAVYTDRKPCAP